MTTDTVLQFDHAITIFKETPNAENLMALNQAAVTLLSPSPRAWTRVDTPDAFNFDYSEIRVLADRVLSLDEAGSLSGCLGYALRQALAGEDLSEPSISYWRDDADAPQATVLEYSYDATKSRRDDPDHVEAFALARAYIAEGSPIRTTDRAGRWTRGTRLVQGIAPCTLTFWVR